MAGRRRIEHAGALTPEAFGWMLKDRRARAGWKIAPLARDVPCDPSLLSRYEAAERVPRLGIVERIDEILATDGVLARAWLEVAWHREVDHPDWFRRFAEMEAQAVLLREYHDSLISGLLQTPAYARALLARGDAAGDRHLIEERVAARMSRQVRFLADEGPMLVVVLDEAVIRRVVGGRQVMYEQLKHLLTVARRPNIVLQVAPFELGERAPAGVSLTLVTLPGGAEWLYSESLDRGHFISDPQKLARQARSYDRLRADALSTPESARLIRSVMEGLVNMNPKADISTAGYLKSSYSGGNGGQCIEVSSDFMTAGLVPVRDSKDPQGPVLTPSVDAFARFITAVKAGRFDLI